MPRPSIEAICEAQRDLIDGWWRLWRGVATTCWACGFYGITPERAHIVARCHGGTNDPSNFFLLCHACHREQPDGATREAQLHWLENHEWWEEKFERIARPILAEIERRAGDPAVYSAWADHVVPRMRDVIFAGAARSAGTGSEQTRRNAMWALVDDFEAWKAARPS